MENLDIHVFEDIMLIAMREELPGPAMIWVDAAFGRFEIINFKPSVVEMLSIAEMTDYINKLIKRYQLRKGLASFDDAYLDYMLQIQKGMGLEACGVAN